MVTLTETGHVCVCVSSTLACWLARTVLSSFVTQMFLISIIQNVMRFVCTEYQLHSSTLNKIRIQQMMNIMVFVEGPIELSAPIYPIIRKTSAMRMNNEPPLTNVNAPKVCPYFRKIDIAGAKVAKTIFFSLRNKNKPKKFEFVRVPAVHSQTTCARYDVNKHRVIRQLKKKK